jgi:hypothetical protein
MNETQVHPQWIAKMYAGKAGRDHLGLGSVSSDQILPSLSPSINVLTFHPRYHSFYIFLLDEFWRRDRPRSIAAWRSFYRPREFIFSVGAYMCEQPEHGEMGNIVGGQKTSTNAVQSLDIFDTTFHYIDSTFGGYGMYYYTVMTDLGLIYPGGRGMPYPIEVPTELGKEVAAAFRKAVEGTTYYNSYFNDDETKVPRDVVKEYIHKACLCQLQVDDAPDRPLLQDIFLHGGQRKEAASRRETFRLFLDISDQTDGTNLTQVTFRQLIFFRETEEGLTYSPSESVRSTYIRWRLYQAREYYAYALNGLWYHLCDWGIKNNGTIQAFHLYSLWDYVNHALDFDALASSLGLPSPGFSAGSSFRQLLDWLQNTVGADQDGFDQACTIHSPIHEHKLYQLANDNRSLPHVMVAGMVTMLALILLRFGKEELWTQPEWEISKMGANGRLSLDGFVRTMQKKLMSGPFTVMEITKWLYEDYIILQHLLVANGKLPENTFRFQRDGQRLRFFNLNNSLSFMDSRFNSISTTIYELGFCGDMSLPDHALTSQGRQLLSEGDLL